MDIPVNKMSMDLKFFQAASIPEERIHTLRDETVDTLMRRYNEIGGMDDGSYGESGDGWSFLREPSGYLYKLESGCHSIDRYCTPQVNQLLDDFPNMEAMIGAAEL